MPVPRRTAYITDVGSKISVVCAGRIDDVKNSQRDGDSQRPSKAWDDGMRRLFDFLESVRSRYENTFSNSDQHHRRGDYVAKNVGVTRGSGAKVC